MPYSEQLDDRINAVIGDWGATRKKMFGGTCHLIHGNMMCGVYKDCLILRLGEEDGAAALKQPHTKPMDITGRPMKGWVMVEQAGLNEAALEDWLNKARRLVDSCHPNEVPVSGAGCKFPPAETPPGQTTPTAAPGSSFRHESAPANQPAAVCRRPREAAPVRATLELRMTRTGTRSGNRDRRPFRQTTAESSVSAAEE